MINIKLNLIVSGVQVEIEESEYNGDIFSFLDKLTDYINIHKKEINSIELISPNRSNLVEDLPNLERKINNGTETMGDGGSENILKLSKESKINSDKLKLIFDFGANNELPPFLISINKATRTENQRIAIIILLYLNKIFNNEDKLSSRSINPILVKSNIDPEASSKAFKGENTKFVKIEGQNYRITPQGILEARKHLKELSESLGV